MTIYAEELRIMMDAIMDIIFDHGEEAQRDAAAKEAEAEKARGEAKAEEQRQKSHQ